MSSTQCVANSVGSGRLALAANRDIRSRLSVPEQTVYNPLLRVGRELGLPERKAKPGGASCATG